jgi:hypothetical protein
MRRLARLCLVLAAVANAAATAWVLSQNPFASAVVMRTDGELRRALERAMARTVTGEWLLPRLEVALAEGDRDRLEMLAGLAATHGIALPPGILEQIGRELAPPDFAERAAECAACAWDVRTCPSLRFIAACALPVELTPAGDANALRRQAALWIAGEEVDGIETGLALVGLGATAAVLVSGGSGAVVKAGATVARLARRMGSLSPGLTRLLREAAEVPVRWDRVAPLLSGRAALDEVVDLSRLFRLGEVAGEIGSLAMRTSPAEALVLLRHVDSAEDAARLARLSAVTGPETRAAIEVLGKARAFRALVRVSDLALAAIGLVALLAAQIGSALLSLLLAVLRRALAPRPVARPRKPRHDRAAMGGSG